MAEPAFVVLRAGGVTIEAESSAHSFAPADGIELVDYSQPGSVAFTEGGATGRRSYKPITFHKRIDKASPPIARTLAENQVVEADFHFFRDEGGTPTEFFLVQVTQGRIVSFRQFLDDALYPANADRPPLEEVGLLPHRIVWTYSDGGITFEDTWGPHV